MEQTAQRRPALAERGGNVPLQLGCAGLRQLQIQLEPAILHVQPVHLLLQHGVPQPKIA
jgi:hypothetical protein